MDIFEEYGYTNKEDYLRSLAYDYDLPYNVVVELAAMLGDSELFDGLVNACEDAEEYYGYI